MTDFIKQLLCKHEYTFVGTIYTLWESNEGKTSTLRTDLLECKHCKKRRVIYQHEFLVGQLFRDYMNLWKKYQCVVPEEWFKANKEENEN